MNWSFSEFSASIFVVYRRKPLQRIAITSYLTKTYNAKNRKTILKLPRNSAKPFVLTLKTDFAHTPALTPNRQDAEQIFFRIRLAKERDTE